MMVIENLRQQMLFVLKVLLFVSLFSCETKTQKQPTPPPEKVVNPVKETKTGYASFYAKSFQGKETFEGKKFDNNQMVAAHPTYPIGTIVRVTNLVTQDTIQVRIGDRGPTKKNQKEGIIIDLSRAAAARLNMLGDGRQKVLLEVLEWGKENNGTDTAR